MGLFGGGNSSSKNETNNIDNRTIEENQNEGDLSGNKGTIYYTGGESFALARSAIETVRDGQQTAIAQIAEGLNSGYESYVTGGAAQVSSKLTDVMKYGAVAVAVLAGITLMSKR